MFLKWSSHINNMRYWDGELYCRGTSVKSNCAFWVLGEIKLFIKKALFKQIYEKQDVIFGHVHHNKSIAAYA